MKGKYIHLKTVFIVLYLLGYGFISCAHAQRVLDVEASIVVPSYNNVAVPGDNGTRFSLTDDLDAKNATAFRLRYSQIFSGKHWIAILAAPLTMESHGTLHKSIDFNGTTFPEGSSIDATFRFDSYRLMYRYRLHQTDMFQFRLGGALKVRDAAIKLESNGLKSEKNNTGVVPLLSFNLTWMPFKKFYFLIDGEALAAPQGRAEDILFAAQYNAKESFSLRLGYRLLEGGADNDEVYTFSLFHYILAGATWLF